MRSKRRVLFVCGHNRVRSPTAATVYRSRPDLEVRSAGIAEYAAVPLTQEMLDWADLVFVFSKRQRKAIVERFRASSGSRNLVCVPVPDVFEYKSPKLVTMLTGKLRRYLGKPADNARSPIQGLAAPAPAPVAGDISQRGRNRLKSGGGALWSAVCGLRSGLDRWLAGASEVR